MRRRFPSGTAFPLCWSLFATISFGSGPVVAAADGSTLPAGPAAGAAAGAETETPGEADANAVPLDELVIAATRTPQPLARTASSITALSLDRLADRQIGSLAQALAFAPGVAVTNTGAIGGQSAVFVRGASSHQVLFIVDGVRMNDRSAAYSNFLGGADLAGLDRIEVLRGPQSTLYGSSAMGGVILLETAHGGEGFGGQLAGTTGSFSSFGEQLAVRGGHASDGLGFSASFTDFETDNDRPANGFRQWSGSGRVELRPAARLRIGATTRLQRGDYEEPGSRFFPTAAAVAADNTLITTYAAWEATDDLDSRLTYGWHRRDYRYADQFGTSHLRNTRHIVDWQNTWRPGRPVEIVAGVNAEWSKYLVEPHETDDDILAEYLSGTIAPLEDVLFSLGVRHDDYASAGDATTWRAGASWLLDDGSTKLRATYGTGFSAPGSDDRFGVPQWNQLPNGALRPERSRGWDFGIDRYLLDRRVTVSATWFENRFRDLFEFEIVDPATFSGRIVNRARATTRGIELGVAASFASWLQGRFSYTYLEAKNDTSGERLVRRPRHTADADLQAQPARAWTIGVGSHLVADREDAGQDVEDFTTVRLYTSYALGSGLTVRARVENAFDEAYEEVLGYPALPRAAYASVEWRF